jgi:LmbE family N-acetylglucosaminyl deacetylase
MSIHAHPDDQEFTVADSGQVGAAGCEVISSLSPAATWVQRSAHDASYKPELARLREGEQNAANDLLGVKQTIYLHYPDGELEPTLALRKELTKLIRTHKPDVVVTGDPQAVFYGNGYINHPDTARQPRQPRMPSSPRRGHACFLPNC